MGWACETELQSRRAAGIQYARLSAEPCRAHTRGASTASSHLVEEDLVVHLLLQLSLRPFLRCIGREDNVTNGPVWAPENTPPVSVHDAAGCSALPSHAIPAVTFFLPLPADMAAMALASLDFCSFGACGVASGACRSERGRHTSARGCHPVRPLHSPW